MDQFSALTVEGVGMKQVGTATIASAVAAAVLSTLVNSAEGAFDLSGVALNLVQIGGPTALGAAAANVVYGPTLPSNGKGGVNYDLSSYAVRGAISGATATAVLMYAGALPVVFDSQTFAFAGLVAAATAIGDAFTLLQLF